MPKHVFSHYKSTVANLKVGHKTPFFMYAVFLCALAIPVLLFYSYKSFTEPKKPAQSAQKSKGSPVSGVPASDSAALASGDSPVISYASGVDAASVAATSAYSDSFTPVVAGRPDTAPVFAALRKVSVVPRVASCIQSATKCVCYTQQSTRIDMTQELCEQTLKAGFPFDPYGTAFADSGAAQSPALPSAWSRTEPLQPEAVPPLTAQDKRAINDYQSSKTPSNL